MAKETKSLGKKNDLDKFYTKSEIASYCLSLIKNIEDYDIVIEPSAGNGSFSNLVENCAAYDISPDNEKITCKNWFDVVYPVGNILIIGNPPFGQQNSLAIKFFNHSAQFAKTIAFILPLSFKKDSLKNKLNLSFSLEYEEVLPKNSFLLNGKDYDVPTVFQIWEKSSIKREKTKNVLTTKLFNFTNSKDADLRIQRVGGSAGKAFKDFKGAETSNYYLKLNENLNIDDFVEKINLIVFPSIEFTTGPKSLSKTEMITEIEKIFDIIEK